MDEDMLTKMFSMMEQKKTADDNLLRAIGMLAAGGHMTIVKNEIRFHKKPVIMLPASMYDRLTELFPAPASTEERSSRDTATAPSDTPA